MAEAGVARLLRTRSGFQQWSSHLKMGAIDSLPWRWGTCLVNHRPCFGLNNFLYALLFPCIWRGGSSITPASQGIRPVQLSRGNLAQGWGTTSWYHLIPFASSRPRVHKDIQVELYNGKGGVALGRTQLRGFHEQVDFFTSSTKVNVNTTNGGAEGFQCLSQLCQTPKSLLCFYQELL